MDTLSPARPAVRHSFPSADVAEVYGSLKRLEAWVEAHDYEAYEPFDCLSSPLRRFTRNSVLLDRLLQQVGRQSPINVRPLIGVKPLPSTKGRGYMAAGYLVLYRLTGDAVYAHKAVKCLDWLIEHKSPKYPQFSWANHFDYASRGGRYGTHDSIIVWTGLIGQAFLDGFETLGDRRFLTVAESACDWILALPREETPSGTCISYHMLGQNSVHNASMLGAALLARTWRHSPRAEWRALAASAMEYSCSRQLADGGWWYGEDEKYRWIDNFHTAYNLDSLKCYVENSGDTSFQPVLDRGFAYFVKTFFDADGRPRYYHDRAQPIDIQCASQAIETLSRFADMDPAALDTARRVARWTITHMQDDSGYFYYRKYPLITARIPMLHWGQGTMYLALACLLSACHPAKSPGD
jgi:hypothetical protein